MTYYETGHMMYVRSPWVKGRDTAMSSFTANAIWPDTRHRLRKNVGRSLRGWRSRWPTPG